MEEKGIKIKNNRKMGSDPVIGSDPVNVCTAGYDIVQPV